MTSLLAGVLINEGIRRVLGRHDILQISFRKSEVLLEDRNGVMYIGEGVQTPEYKAAEYSWKVTPSSAILNTE